VSMKWYVCVCHSRARLAKKLPLSSQCILCCNRGLLGYFRRPGNWARFACRISRISRRGAVCALRHMHILPPALVSWIGWQLTD
jgi:hypothetical protein